MFKKLSAVIIAICMLTSCFGSLVYADVNALESEELSYEARLCIGLGAIDSYDADKQITQGELAQAINAIGAYNTIADLYIKKSEYNEAVTLKDAVAVMCDLIGYTVIINKTADGSIDKDHAITIAQKQGLLKSVSGKYTETLTCKDLAMLVANVIEADTVDMSYRTDGSIGKIEIDGEQYGTRAISVYTVDGIVRSTSYSSIISERGTEDSTIDINGVSFDCNVGEYEDYIGMRVTAIIKKEDRKDVVKALYADSNVLRISARDLKPSEITKTSITYYDEKGREDTVKLSQTADALYNYSLYRDFGEEDLKLKQGALVLIDNDGDKRYDIVRIEEYKSMQIFSASVMSEKISDSKGNVLSISELIDNNYPIIENGKAINPENIPINAVATYYMNKSGEVVRIYISSELAGGTISGFEKDNNKIFFTDEEFENEYIYTEEIKADLEALPIGTQIMVNVNHYGEIAHFDVTADSYRYGYMVGFESGKGLGSPRVKIFTQDSDFKIYETKSTIIVNGVTMSADKAFSEDNMDTGLYDELGPVTQIVKYKANNKGVIREIATSSRDDYGAKRLHKEKDGVFTYYKTPRTICADTRLDLNTKVFLIPTELDKEEKFKYGNYSILTNDTDYTAQVYDIDENRNAGVVVARIDPYGSDATLDDINGSVYVVDRCGKFIADDGEESVFADVYKLGSTSTERTRIKFSRKEISSTLQSSTVTVDMLRQGDVIIVATDTHNSAESTKMKLLYRVGETEDYEQVKQQWFSASNATTFISDGQSYVAGRVLKLVKDGFITNPKPGEYLDRIITTTGITPVRICDTSAGRISIGSIADLQEGDIFFSVMREAIPKEIIIYR